MEATLTVFIDPETGFYEFQNKRLTKAQFEILKASLPSNLNWIQIEFVDPPIKPKDK
jgi:hypothetical protein